MGQVVRRLQPHLIAQPGGQVRCDLGGAEEEPGRAVGPQDRLADGQGRTDHIAAADVEQPGNGGGCCDHGGIRAALGQGLAEAVTFSAAILAGILQRMRHDGRRGLCGSRHAPGRIQRVGTDGLQLRAGLGDGRLQARQGVGAVQTGVVSDHRALWGGFEVGRNAALHEVADLKDALIDLIADLQGVAAVDEDGRLVLQDHRGAGRAGEAGGPGQTIVRGGQVLVLVLVFMGGDEAVETLLRHGFADQRHVFGAEGGVGGFIEGLAHADDLAARTGPGKVQTTIIFYPGKIDGPRCRGY